jgi:predicted signal transduction protein with EAL and GGDEF domain/FixJ family two-component response regulator
MIENQLSILVVDDDEDACTIMCAALGKAGFATRVAHSGSAALTEFRRLAPDMIMLDVDMPDMDGHAVCSTLRLEADPLLPIVMVTGMDDLKSIELAYQNGATDFIAKPVNWGLVGHRVRYLFRGYQAALTLRNAEARHAGVLNAIPDLLFEVDQNGRCIDCRIPSSHALSSFARSFTDKTFNDILGPEAADVCNLALQDALRDGHSEGAQFSIELENRTTWFELSISRKPDTRASERSVIMLARDITERRAIHERVTRLAFFDELTGLPNRQSFLERVDKEIRRASLANRQLAVLFMDLDGFKNVNDTLGHASGDVLLKWTAERLKECLRPGDLISRVSNLPSTQLLALAEDIEIARLGGDEFTALIVDMQTSQDAMGVARRIVETMRRPFVLEGREITLTTSIGIAVYPEDGTDGATLLKHADTAMYHAKRTGRNNAKLYSSALTREITQRIELESSLRNALEKNEFHLLYQPQIALTSRRTASVEALIRWQHPTRGLIPPLEFIPLAEETGLIERIGEWVLRTAISDVKEWVSAGSNVTVAVNLSPVQFADPNLAEHILSMLADADLPPAHLEIEVTESTLMENSSSIRETLRTLRHHGVHIALDDFGTGYSSLAYLTRMPISRIKVDRCFVNDLMNDVESVAIVRAVLAMAHSLGMEVTAEGVETEDQAALLESMACDAQQGFYYSKPVPAADIPSLLVSPWVHPDFSRLQATSNR